MLLRRFERRDVRPGFSDDDEPRPGGTDAFECMRSRAIDVPVSTRADSGICMGGEGSPSPIGGGGIAGTIGARDGGSIESRSPSAGGSDTMSNRAITPRRDWEPCAATDEARQSAPTGLTSFVTSFAPYPLSRCICIDDTSSTTSSSTTSSSTGSTAPEGQRVYVFRFVEHRAMPSPGFHVIGNDASGALVDEADTDSDGYATLDIPDDGSVSALTVDGDRHDVTTFTARKSATPAIYDGTSVATYPDRPPCGPMFDLTVDFTDEPASARYAVGLPIGKPTWSFVDLAGAPIPYRLTSLTSTSSRARGPTLGWSGSSACTPRRASRGIAAARTCSGEHGRDAARTWLR